MGCFGYICKGCGTSIRGNCYSGGEKCILIHVRHGKEVGRVEGHYDEYGRVIEQDHLTEDEKYRGDSNGINGHREICDSEFGLEDSFLKLQALRLYHEKPVNHFNYLRLLVEELEDPLHCAYISKLSQDQQDAIKHSESISLEAAAILARVFIREYLSHCEETAQGFLALPKFVGTQYSGTVAWHSLCYQKANTNQQEDLTPSESDPDQSWGKVRKKYC